MIAGGERHSGRKMLRPYILNFKLNNMDNTTRKKGFSWDLLLKIVIAVASAVVGALGVSACR